MIADLRADSAGFERLGTRGQSYEESIIHLSRQWYGPTYDQTQVVPPAAVARQYTAADPSTWADNQASTSRYFRLTTLG
jgi:hypothetical protein